MADDKDDFTPEEVKLNEVLKKASAEIEKIEQEISKIPDDPKPAPRLTPFKTVQTVGRKEALVAEKNNQRKEIEDRTRKEIEKDIKESQKMPTAIMVQKMTEWNKNTAVYPMTIKEERGVEKKDISKSQDFALKLKALSEERNSNDKYSKDYNGKEDTNKESSGNFSISKKFEMSLGYTQLSEKQKQDIQKGGFETKGHVSDKQTKAESFAQNRDNILDKD